MNKNKINEWIYRIICFTLFQSLILVVGFVAMHYGISLMVETRRMTWGVQAGFIQSSLAICLLQLANILYWICGINILDFKKLFREKIK